MATVACRSSIFFFCCPPLLFEGWVAAELEGLLCQTSLLKCQTFKANPCDRRNQREAAKGGAHKCWHWNYHNTSRLRAHFAPNRSIHGGRGDPHAITRGPVKGCFDRTPFEVRGGFWRRAGCPLVSLVSVIRLWLSHWVGRGWLMPTMYVALVLMAVIWGLVSGLLKGPSFKSETVENKSEGKRVY